KKPTRYRLSFLITDADGSLLLGKRPDSGLLATLWEPPGTDLAETLPSADPSMLSDTHLLHRLNRDFHITTTTPRPLQEVRHTFTHFHLRQQVLHATHLTGIPHSDLYTELRFIPIHALTQYALSSLAKKTVKTLSSQV
ncbi:MAG: NUDIX domain-containing protein, partial [Magnetococcales bacterium]|nr:NUDIX domain-containing protein [Magnetococcales bacterium]